MNLLNLQTKLMVGHPGNQYEQEADQVASRVMRMSASVPSQTLQCGGVNEEQVEPLVQTKSLGESIMSLGQRQPVEEEEKRLQLQTARAETSQADADVEKTVKHNQDGGCCLPYSVREYMEPRFGVDFSEVRVHQGSESAKMNKALGAQAFTVGNNIFLEAGKAIGNSYLLAHELTHVVQQAGGPPASLEKKKAVQRPYLTFTTKSRAQKPGPTYSKKHSQQRKYSPSISVTARLANQTVSRSPAPTSNNCWLLKAKCYYHCTKKHLWRYPPDTKGFQRCKTGCCDRAFHSCKTKGTWPCLFPGM